MLVKGGQFSLASQNQCFFFLIRQWTAGLKRDSVALMLHQVDRLLVFFYILFQCRTSQSSSTYSTGSQVTSFMMQFVCNKHIATSSPFLCCRNHLFSNMKLFIIFPCAFALNMLLEFMSLSCFLTHFVVFCTRILLAEV